MFSLFVESMWIVLEVRIATRDHPVFMDHYRILSWSVSRVLVLRSVCLLSVWLLAGLLFCLFRPCCCPGRCVCGDIIGVRVVVFGVVCCLLCIVD